MLRLWSRFLGGRNIPELKSRFPLIKYPVILDYVGEKGNFLEENFSLASQFHNQTIALKLTSLGLPNEDLAYQNAFKVISEAARNGNRVLIDAEDFKNQRKINQISDQLILDFNQSHIQVFKTYQMYYKNSLDYLLKDLEIYQNKKLGIKLVRGAYYHQDKSFGFLCENKSMTDWNYNSAVKKLFEKPKGSVILATHNIGSCMLGLKTSPNFDYAQLLGMSDQLSYNLQKAGVQVYKYVPYGGYLESSSYMLRRLYENLDMLKNV